MKKISATAALWLANMMVFVALITVIGFAAWRFFIGGTAALPEISPLKVKPTIEPIQVAEPGSRNPFDPSGSHWFDAQSDDLNAPRQGGLKGFVVLPGVSLILTENGVVKPGGAFGEGTLKGIKGNQISVETATGITTVDGPSVGRPRMENINQAGKTVKPLDRPTATGERKS